MFSYEYANIYPQSSFFNLFYQQANHFCQTLKKENFVVEYSNQNLRTLSFNQETFQFICMQKSIIVIFSNINKQFQIKTIHRQKHNQLQLLFIENEETMRAQTHLLPTEPITHTSQSHWRQCLICQDYTINTEQLHKYYALKQQANILFQGSNQRWDLLRSLYNQYFNQENPAKDGKIPGRHWMRLGFQGQYPQTDFRGGGVLSLQLILGFVRGNKQLVKKMQKDEGSFFFAITAINICFYLKKYFHLADFLMPGKDQQDYCNRRAFKNFCRILVTNQNFFQQLHQKLLCYFYKDLWLQKMKKIGGQQMLLNFNPLFQILKKNINNVFQQNNLFDQHDFENRWRQTAQING